MKNINKIALYSLLFFSASTDYGYSATQFFSDISDIAKPVVHAGKKTKDFFVYHAKGKDAAAILATAKAQGEVTIELAKAVSSAAPTVAGSIKQAADAAQQVDVLKNATSALNVATNNTQEAAAILKEILKKTDTNTTTLQKLQTIADKGKKLSGYDKLLGAGAVVTIIIGGGHFYYWAKSKIYPSNTKQLKDVVAKDRLEIIQTKKVLMAKLALHAYQKRDQDGLPYACKESADKLFVLGAGDELTEIIKQFKQRYGEQAPC